MILPIKAKQIRDTILDARMNKQDPSQTEMHLNELHEDCGIGKLRYIFEIFDVMMMMMMNILHRTFSNVNVCGKCLTEKILSQISLTISTNLYTFPM